MSKRARCTEAIDEPPADIPLVMVSRSKGVVAVNASTTPTTMRSRMVITGDLSQTDLPKDVKSGLGDAIRKVEGIEGIGCVRFSDTDVVRHPLAAKIVHAYEEWDKKKKTPSGS